MTLVLLAAGPWGPQAFTRNASVRWSNAIVHLDVAYHPFRALCVFPIRRRARAQDHSPGVPRKPEQRMPPPPPMNPLFSQDPRQDVGLSCIRVANAPLRLSDVVGKLRRCTPRVSPNALVVASGVRGHSNSLDDRYPSVVPPSSACKLRLTNAQSVHWARLSRASAARQPQTHPGSCPSYSRALVSRAFSNSLEMLAIKALLTTDATRNTPAVRTAAYSGGAASPAQPAHRRRATFTTWQEGLRALSSRSSAEPAARCASACACAIATPLLASHHFLTEARTCIDRANMPGASQHISKENSVVVVGWGGGCCDFSFV